MGRRWGHAEQSSSEECASGSRPGSLGAAESCDEYIDLVSIRPDQLCVSCVVRLVHFEHLALREVPSSMRAIARSARRHAAFALAVAGFGPAVPRAGSGLRGRGLVASCDVRMDVRLRPTELSKWNTVRGKRYRREIYSKILVGLCAVFDIDPQQWNRLSLTRLPNTVESRTRHLSTTKIVGAQHSKEDKDVEPGTGPTRLELADGER
jgi:hypothetical protein